MAGKTRSTVLPTSIEEVELKGEGGLRRAFVFRTVISIVLMGIVFLIASLSIFRTVLKKQLASELADVAYLTLTYYDDVYPGEYSLDVDKDGNPVMLNKGAAQISGDLTFLEEIAEETDSDITVFFSNIRLMSTLVDNRGNSIVGTIANDNITTSVLINAKEDFFDNVEIGKVRYCVAYVPIMSTSDKCIGMIGVGRPYDEAFSFVHRLSVAYAVIILLSGAVAAVWIVGYTTKLVNHLDKLKDFLGKIASGYLDDELDQTVLDREDEVGDMGRCALFVRGALKKLVEKDPLTNLNNRRSGQIKMDQIRKNAAKYGTKYAVAIGDIDFFKKVNDTYGHDAGDAVLREVARILSDKMAGKGTVIRWGGEEFLFVFEECGMEEARDYLWEILQAIRETYVDYEANVIRFTMSFGVVRGNPNIRSEEDVNAADDLLYYAKEHGRNRVCSAKNEEMVEPAGLKSPLTMLDGIVKAESEAAREETAKADERNASDAGRDEPVKDEEKETEDSAADKEAEDPAADKEEETETEAPVELWDIYDRNKEITGRTMEKNDFTMKDGDYHLTVLGVIVNSQGEFLVTRRVMSKSYAPGWWEISGGAAQAGESSYKAVVREIKEETGLDVTGAGGGYMFTYRRDNPDEGDNYFVDVYRFEMDFADEDVHIQSEEADGYMLAKAGDIKELGEEGVFLHYNSIKEVFNL